MTSLSQPLPSPSQHRQEVSLVPVCVHTCVNVCACVRVCVRVCSFFFSSKYGLLELTMDLGIPVAF